MMTWRSTKFLINTERTERNVGVVCSENLNMRLMIIYRFHIDCQWPFLSRVDLIVLKVTPGQSWCTLLVVDERCCWEATYFNKMYNFICIMCATHQWMDLFEHSEYGIHWIDQSLHYVLTIFSYSWCCADCGACASDRISSHRGVSTCYISEQTTTTTFNSI